MRGNAFSIRSLDDICSLIFSFGFLIVVNFLYSVVIMAVCTGLALLVSNLFFDGRFLIRLFWVGIGLLLGLQLAGNLADRTIGCLASLFEIELDANRLTELDFDYTRDPGIGRASIVTYIPIADLEPGRHELVVVAPSHEMSRGDTDAVPDRHRIPFWR